MSPVCYIYTSPPSLHSFFISSNYVFHPINLSLSIYLYPPPRFARRLVCSLAAKHFDSLINPHLLLLRVTHTHTRTVDWEIKRRLLMQVVKTKSHIVYIVTVQRKVKRNRLSVSRLARCYIRRLHHAQQSHWKVIFCHVDVSPYGRTGVRGEYVRNLSPLYRSGASYFCLSRPLWWNSGGSGSAPSGKCASGGSMGKNA